MKPATSLCCWRRRQGTRYWTRATPPTATKMARIVTRAPYAAAPKMGHILPSGFEARLRVDRLVGALYHPFAGKECKRSGRSTRNRPRKRGLDNGRNRWREGSGVRVGLTHQ